MDLKEYGITLGELESRLERLRVLYDQYFQGLERLEPTVVRKEFERRLHLLRKEQIRNTALKYRMQQLVQKYTSFITYWTRVARQIEEGTYRRDILKARRMREIARQQRQDQRDGYDKLDVDEDMPTIPPPPATPHDAEPVTLRPLEPSKEKTPSNRSPSKSAAGSDSKKKKWTTTSAPTREYSKPPPGQKAKPSDPFETIFSRLVEAKKANGEKTEHLKFDDVKNQIIAQLPKALKKSGGREVDFQPVVVNGKVGLKPVIKK